MRPVKRLLLLILVNFSIVCGLSAVVFDLQRRRIVQHKAIRIYAMLHTLAMMLSTPFAIQLSLMHLKIYETNPLSWYTNVANVLTRTLVVFLIILLRRQLQPKMLEILRRLMQLEAEYFDHLVFESHRPQPRFFVSLGMKVAYVFFQLYAICHAVVRMVRTGGPVNLIIGFYIINMVAMMYAFCLYFAALLTWITKLFHLLNERLLDIHAELSERLGSRESTANLDEILVSHNTLSKLVASLCDICKYHLLLLMATFFISNSTTGYYLVVASKGRVFKLSIVELLSTYAMNLLLIVDLYLFYSICGRTEYTSARTFEILRQFSDLPTIQSPQFERSCEMLWLVLVREKVRVRIHGMFNLNRHSIFLLIAETIMYTIVFVQSDYMNM